MDREGMTVGLMPLAFQEGHLRAMECLMNVGVVHYSGQCKQHQQLYQVHPLAQRTKSPRTEHPSGNQTAQDF